MTGVQTCALPIFTAAWQVLDQARRGEGEIRLAARELTWVAQMLELACRIGLARLEASGNGDLADVGTAARRALLDRLQPLLDDYPLLWLARNRPGGLRDSIGRLRALEKSLSGC